MGKSSLIEEMYIAMFDYQRVCCSCCEGEADGSSSCILADYSPQVHMNPWSPLLRLLNDT